MFITQKTITDYRTQFSDGMIKEFSVDDWGMHKSSGLLIINFTWWSAIHEQMVARNARIPEEWWKGEHELSVMSDILSVVEE